MSRYTVVTPPIEKWWQGNSRYIEKNGCIYSANEKLRSRERRPGDWCVEILRDGQWSRLTTIPFPNAENAVSVMAVHVGHMR